MRCVALRHWKSLAAKYTRKLNAVERVFETRYKQENISDVTTSLEICEHCIAKQQFSLVFVVVASVTSFEVELESNGRSVLKYISLEKYRKDGIVLICELKDEEQVVEGRYSLFLYFTYYLISV